MLIPDNFEEQDLPHASPGAGLSEAATPNGFGAQVAQTIDYGAQVQARLHFDAAAQANQIAAMDKANALESWTQKATRDPESGLFNKNLGANAPAASQKLLSDYDSVSSEQRAGLVNDQQRLTFDRMSAAHRQDLASSSDAYAGHQLTQHAQQVYGTTIGLAHNAIAQDPSDAPRQVARIQAVAEQHAQFLGLDADSTQLMVGQATSDAHLSAVEALTAQGDSQGAAQYLAAHRSEITDADALDKATRMTKAASQEQQAQQIGNDVLGGTKIAGSGGLYDRSAVNAQIEGDPRLKDNPELRKSVVAYTDSEIQHHQEAVNQQNSQGYSKVYGMLRDNDGTFTPEASAAAANLPPELQKSLEREGAYMRSPDPVVNDDQAFADFIEKSATDRKYLRDMTASQFVSSFSGKFDSQRYSQAIGIWQDALAHRHAQPTVNPGEPTSAASAAAPPDLPNQDLVQKAKEIGLNPAQSARFYTGVQQDLNDLDTKYKGGVIPPEERAKTISDAVANAVFVPIPGAFRPTPAALNRGGVAALGNDFLTNDWTALDQWNATPVAQRVPLQALTEEDLGHLPPARATAIREQLRPPGALSADEFKRAAQGAAAAKDR